MHGNCLNFLLWVIIFVFVAEKCLQNELIDVLYQHAKSQQCFQILEISYAGMANFAISLLMLMIFPIIRGFLSESSANNRCIRYLQWTLLYPAEEIRPV